MPCKISTKEYEEWLSQQSAEDIEWHIKVHGNIAAAYQAYQDEKHHAHS